jgi:hypothetical protein
VRRFGSCSNGVANKEQKAGVGVGVGVRNVCVRIVIRDRIGERDGDERGGGGRD